MEMNSFGAEFGHTNGGVVNAVTRSGSNQFHGNVYEFLRNDKLDAKGWGNDALPPLRRNNEARSAGRSARIRHSSSQPGLPDSARRRQHHAMWACPRFERETFRRRGMPAPRRGSGYLRSHHRYWHVYQSGQYDALSEQHHSHFALDPVAVKAMTYLPAPNRAPDNPFNNAQLQTNSANTIPAVTILPASITS